MKKPMQSPKSEETKTSGGNFWSFIGDKVFPFFGKVLENVKKDNKLAILWGFGVLVLVLVIVTFILAGDVPPIGKLVIAIVTIVFLGVIFIYTLSKIEPIEPKSPIERQNSESLSIDQMIIEFGTILNKLEKDKGVVAQFKERGDSSRLLDGLYSGLLYSSLALTKGHVDPLFYGNLMELDKNRNFLHLRYLSGLYNVDMIAKEYPVDGVEESVARTAFISGENQILNSTKNISMVFGQQRQLQAMMSIPIEQSKNCGPGAIAVLNIDSAMKDVFPVKGDAEYDEFIQRAEAIKELLRRVNKLRFKLLN